MDLSLVFALVFVLAAVVVGVYVLAVQRRLTSLDEQCGDSIHQMAILINARWDAMEGLARGIFRCSASDGKLMLDLIEGGRRSSLTDFNTIVSQNKVLVEVWRMLNVACERYDEVRCGALYISQCASLPHYDEAIGREMEAYAAAADGMRKLMSCWSSALVASMLGFDKRWRDELRCASNTPLCLAIL